MPEPELNTQSKRDFSDNLPLSKRELEVLELVKDGKTNRTVAARLGISERTAREHVARILLKLGVGSRVEAAVIATEWRIRRQIHGSHMPENLPDGQPNRQGTGVKANV
ncbi:response regulator transcription factor [Plantactinospora sp. S1510]|uniref:Response regulator transcription factor n=1 Tax=Plantactinospora alkalitolerans TaxID=2789879 RepID=A0ABS0H2X3_9ACTN|nr:LuxR C-terminal-related transcriptional regulator [Plantactinospora alkalitolerans]MBF9132812.1 response regulator transcription factor [Plantactinospora alkalitolerans]